MANLQGTLQDLDRASFKLDKNNDIARNVCSDDLVAQPSGLSVAGKITEVALNSSTWTALPATALTDRNGLGIQNPTAVEIKLNFDTGVATFTGWSIKANGETFVDITDAVTIYAKSASGTPTIVVMEVS